MLLVLEELIHEYPKDSYVLTLAGVYSELGETKKQLALTEALYEKGYIDGKSHAVNLANLYGEDKLTLDERAAWADRHKTDILAVADNPMKYLWWTTADKPWQFLAACLEWDGFMREGESFLSHLPVLMKCRPFLCQLLLSWKKVMTATKKPWQNCKIRFNPWWMNAWKPK